MCEKCSEIILYDKIYSPKEYLNCIEYIKGLLTEGGYILTEKSCEIDKIKDENSCWADDIITHVIKCKKCGQEFRLCVDTYHGTGGSFTLTNYKSKWKNKAVYGTNGNTVLFGVNIFDYKWIRTDELADVRKSMFGKRHILPVYKVIIDNCEYKFAATEINSYKWIFFTEK